MKNNGQSKTFYFKNHPIKILGFDGHQGSLELDFNEAEVKNKYWNIKEGDVVLDIGSEHGSYALTALACGAKKVIAWEPDKPFAVEENVEANGWSDKCVVLNSALWSDDGYLHPNCPNPPLFQKEPAENFFTTGKLDNSIAANEEKIDWIKIDTEGAELEILKGGINILKKHKPNLLIENHLFKDRDCVKKTKEFLENIGYIEVSTDVYQIGTVSHSYYSAFVDQNTINLYFETQSNLWGLDGSVGDGSVVDNFIKANCDWTTFNSQELAEADVLNINNGYPLDEITWSKQVKHWVNYSSVEKVNENQKKIFKGLPVEWILGKNGGLPFNNEDFSHVFAFCSLGYILDAETRKFQISEIARILKPKGIYCVTENFLDFINLNGFNYRFSINEFIGLHKDYFDFNEKLVISGIANRIAFRITRKENL